MVHVLEGTSTALATNAAAGDPHRARPAAGAFTYLTSHGALDQQHVRFFAGADGPACTPGRPGRVTHAANMVYSSTAHLPQPAALRCSGDPEAP